nr:hypothetical protein [Aeromicrobium camelliae]
MEAVSGRVLVGERLREDRRDPARIDHGVRHERQRTPAERLADERGVDVEDAVPEAVLGPGHPVVRLVRMEDVPLARQARAPAPAITEGLHTETCDAHGVRLVPVRREALTHEARVHPLQPLGELEAAKMLPVPGSVVRHLHDAIPPAKRPDGNGQSRVSGRRTRVQDPDGHPRLP